MRRHSCRCSSSSLRMEVRVVANRVSRKVLYLEADHAFVDLLFCFLHLPLAFIFDFLFTKDSCLPQVGCISNAYQSLCSLIRNPPLQEASGVSYIVTDDLNILRVSNTMENLELLSKLKVTNMANLNKVETSITVDEALELLKCSFTSKTALNMVFGGKVANINQAPESMLCWKQIVQVSSTNISVRFLVKGRTRKIVYMEAGNDFFDMLERFLNTPIAWLMNKFSKGYDGRVPKVGSISNVYQSVYKLSKDTLLVPKVDFMNPTSEKARVSPNILISMLRVAAPVVYTCSRVHGVSLLCNAKCSFCKDHMPYELKVMNSAVLPPMGRHVYKCNKSIERCACVSYARSKWCTSCGELTNREIPIVAGDHMKWTLEPPQFFQGYVKKPLSFIVTDDLKILPASSINNVGLLNELKVFRMGNIHSLEASIGVNEALELLKASFTTGEALNTVLGEQIDRSIPQASRFDCECLDFLLHWLNSLLFQII